MILKHKSVKNIMNLIEISNKYPTELDAIKHFESVRWKKTITSPNDALTDLSAI